MSTKENAEGAPGVTGGPNGDDGGASSSQSDPGERKPQYITPEILSGTQNALKRTITEEIKGIESKLAEKVGSIESNLASIIERFSSSGSDDSSDDDGGKGDKGKGSKSKKVDAEFIRLQREHEALTRSFTELQEKYDATQKQTRESDFTNRLKDAIRKSNPLAGREDYILRAIRHDVQVDESDPTRLYATMKDPKTGQPLELDVETWISNYVASEMLPELFKSGARTGSPAATSSSGDVGKPRFTATQIKDPEFYANNREEIREAIAENRIVDR